MQPPREADRRREWNSHARGGWVALWLREGAKLSNRDIARATGMSRRGAQKMMHGLVLYLPIAYVDRRWQWMEKDDR